MSQPFLLFVNLALVIVIVSQSTSTGFHNVKSHSKDHWHIFMQNKLGEHLPAGGFNELLRLLTQHSQKRSLNPITIETRISNKSQTHDWRTSIASPGGRTEPKGRARRRQLIFKTRYDGSKKPTIDRNFLNQKHNRIGIYHSVKRQIRHPKIVGTFVVPH